jgi:hypothetical protein
VIAFARRVVTLVDGQIVAQVAQPELVGAPG